MPTNGKDVLVFLKSFIHSEVLKCYIIVVWSTESDDEPFEELGKGAESHIVV